MHRAKDGPIGAAGPQISDDPASSPDPSVAGGAFEGGRSLRVPGGVAAGAPVAARPSMARNHAALVIGVVIGLASACGSVNRSNDGGGGSGGAGGAPRVDGGACRTQGESCTGAQHCCGPLICAGTCTMGVNQQDASGESGHSGGGGTSGGGSDGASGGSGGSHVYSCGSQSCTAGASYCYSYTPGTAGTTGRSCQPIPAACASSPTSCACLCPPSSSGAFGCVPVEMGTGNFCSCSDTGGVVNVSCAGS